MPATIADRKGISRLVTRPVPTSPPADHRPEDRPGQQRPPSEQPDRPEHLHADRHPGPEDHGRRQPPDRPLRLPETVPGRPVRPEEGRSVQEDRPEDSRAHVRHPGGTSAGFRPTAIVESAGHPGMRSITFASGKSRSNSFI